MDSQDDRSARGMDGGGVGEGAGPSSAAVTTATPAAAASPVKQEAPAAGPLAESEQPHVPSASEDKGANANANALATSSKVKLEDFDATSGELKVQAMRPMSRREIEFDLERRAAQAGAVLRENKELDWAMTTRLQRAEAFTSYADVVDRLLPWHVWQVHDVDQDAWPKSSKRKAKETERVVELAERKINLERRFRKLRLRAFDTNAMLPADIQAAQVQMEDARTALTQTMSSLRDARATQDRLQEEERVRADAEKKRADEQRRREEEAKKLAKQKAAPPPPPPPPPAAPPPSRPPVPPNQTIVITIPMSYISQLTSSHIVTLPNYPPPPDGKPPPAKVVRTSEDLTKVVISVNVSMCNPAQLNLLASLIQKQKAIATTAASQPSAAQAAPAASATSAGR